MLNYRSVAIAVLGFFFLSLAALVAVTVWRRVISTSSDPKLMRVERYLVILFGLAVVLVFSFGLVSSVGSFWKRQHEEQLRWEQTLNPTSSDSTPSESSSVPWPK